MPNEIPQHGNSTTPTQSTRGHIDLNIESRAAGVFTANAKDVQIANASASWAHDPTPQNETHEDAYLVELMRAIDASGESPVDRSLPPGQRPTVFADEVPRIIADFYGWVRVPRAKSLNPEFIGNVPSGAWADYDGGYNPGQLAA